MTQEQVARAAGVSQGWISELEGGQGSSGSIESWASVAAAVGEELAAFFDHAPGATAPRDLEHLRRQQLLISIAASGGWTSSPEEAIDVGAGSPHFIDVLLRRRSDTIEECAVVEIWDLVLDVGDAMRGLDGKILAVRRDGSPGPGARAVSGCFVVRGTRRNRALVREFADVFRTRFPGSSATWLRALRVAPGGTRGAGRRRGAPAVSRGAPP